MIQTMIDNLFKPSTYKHRLSLGLIAAAFCNTPLAAPTMLYEVQSVSGNTYQYIYTIVNDDLTESIAEFDVVFPASLYQEGGIFENLSSQLNNDAWVPTVIAPDPLFGETDTIFNVINFSTEIGPGETLGGFGVEFDWLGTGLPGSQDFTLYGDFSDFSGATELAAIPVPAAGVLLLSALGFLLSGIGSRTRRLRAINS